MFPARWDWRVIQLLKRNNKKRDQILKRGYLNIDTAYYKIKLRLSNSLNFDSHN